VIIFSLTIISSSAQEKPKTKVVETIDFKTNQFDRIILTTEVYDTKYQLPGSFTNATFEKSGKNVLAVSKTDGYDSIGYSALNGLKNKVSSAYCLVIGDRDVNFIIFQRFSIWVLSEEPCNCKGG